MCNISGNLPTVASFLMLYSLRCGCIFICVWTLLRSILFIMFFLITATVAFMPNTKTEAKPSAEHYIFAFLGYISMIVTECFILMFTIGLGKGLYTECLCLVKDYIICRFCTWIFETISLIILCIFQHYYIGWYLVFLMIIILEFYAFVVVNSYYVEMAEEFKMKECDECAECDESLREMQKGGDTREMNTLESQEMYIQDTRDIRCWRCPPNQRGTRYMRDPRDMQDPRNMRDMQDPRDKRGKQDPRDMRHPRSTGDMQVSEDTHDTQDSQDTQDPRDMRDPRNMRNIQDPRNSRGTRAPLDMRNPK